MKKLVLSTMLLCLTVAAGFSQNILQKISKKGNKVCVLVENMDSVASFPLVVMKQMRNLGYWKIVNNISDADMVLLFTGFKWPTDKGIFLFEGYVKVFDNQMNFIYRSDYVRGRGFAWTTLDEFTENTIKSLVKKLPNNLKKVAISQTSPFYVSSKKVKPYNEVEFDKNYHLLIESIENGQNNEILKYADKCISINSELPELYEIKAGVLMEMNKKPFGPIKKLIELEPLNSNIDYFWQTARYQKSERDVRFAAKMMAIAGAMNAVSGVINTVSVASHRQYNNAAIQQGGTTTGNRNREETCSNCNGTGVNPSATSVAGFGGYHWCDVCKKEVSDSHGYHGQCPSCNGKGYRIRIR
jgi:hypothetical protein